MKRNSQMENLFFLYMAVCVSFPSLSVYLVSSFLLTCFVVGVFARTLMYVYCNMCARVHAAPRWGTPESEQNKQWQLGYSQHHFWFQTMRIFHLLLQRPALPFSCMKSGSASLICLSLALGSAIQWKRRTGTAYLCQWTFPTCCLYPGVRSMDIDLEI